jgi:hypothetical protein
MNKPNYKKAFDKLCSGYITEDKLWNRTDANWSEITGILNVGGKKFIESHVIGYFYRNDETQKHTHANIQFIKIPQRIIVEIFNNENYNYDLVKIIINELFTIGQSFGFYKKMSTIKNIRVEESLSPKNFGMPVLKNVSKLTMADFLKTQRSGPQPFNKMIKQSMYYKCIGDNICPVIEITIPYSNTAYFNHFINLHPLMKDMEITEIDELKEKFTAQLEQQLDIVLMKKIKLSEDDIKKMTLDEKKSYIPVLEMLTV